MITLKPTTLRNNLFQTLHRAARGEKVKIVSKQGTFFLVKQHSRENQCDADKPKVKGSIIGNLDDADKKLRDYLRIPG